MVGGLLARAGGVLLLVLSASSSGDRLGVGGAVHQLTAHSAHQGRKRASVKPKGGCWGTCSGDSGPLPITMEIAAGKVEHFILTDACLGDTVEEDHDFHNAISIPASGAKALKISHGSFAFSGSVPITRPSGPPGEKMPVKLIVNFLGATVAKGTLTITYPDCAPVHFTVRYKSPKAT
jgi:hypothetical protein